MDFLKVTTHLGNLGMTQYEMADALGVSRASVKAARLDPSSPNYRKPPADWREKLMKAARERGGDLLRLAESLGGQGSS